MVLADRQDHEVDQAQNLFFVFDMIIECALGRAQDIGNVFQAGRSKAFLGK